MAQGPQCSFQRHRDHGYQHGPLPLHKSQMSSQASLVVPSLGITSAGNTGHPPPPDPWWQQSPQIETWLQEAARTTHTNMTPDCRANKHQYIFRQHPRPWITAWPSVATQATDITTDPVYSRTMGRHDPWEQHGPRHPHGSRTIIRLPAAAQVSHFLMFFNGKKATDINTDHGCRSIMDWDKAINKFLNIQKEITKEVGREMTPWLRAFIVLAEAWVRFLCYMASCCFVLCELLNTCGWHKHTEAHRNKRKRNKENKDKLEFSF